MSNFAFGTYRVSDLNPLHIEALKEAIQEGVNLIDTSTNYMDGGAERAIGQVLESFDYDIRNRVKIVSKFGYIQGSLLAEHKEKPFEDVVEFSETCYHSIAKLFLQDQLTQSLERLHVSVLDCYLIHNPEYYIYDALKKDIDRDTILDTMYARLYEAFIGLEEEVKEGRIHSYGISSNSFSKKHNHPEFLPYEDLITLAEDAAQEVGNTVHSFTTIELPINLLETEGLVCASWAKEQGLRVLANRPLNAQKDDFMFRLAEYDEPKNYYYALNELLEICDNEQLKNLYTLLEQMDTNKHKFGWIGDYDNFLYAQIIPHIKNTIENISEEVLETLLRYIDDFLVAYREMVAYECAKLTKIALKDLFSSCDEKMQICALKFLLEHKDIDYILVGMRKPTYVHEILALKV